MSASIDASNIILITTGRGLCFLVVSVPFRNIRCHGGSSPVLSVYGSESLIPQCILHFFYLYLVICPRRLECAEGEGFTEETLGASCKS